MTQVFLPIQPTPAADSELRVDVAHLGQLKLLVEWNGFERLCRQLCGNEEQG